MKKKDLMMICRHYKLKNYSKLNKKQLIELLEENSTMKGGFINFGKIFQNIKEIAGKTIKPVIKPVKDLLKYRDRFTNITNKTIEDYGDIPIVSMTIQRCPVNKAIIKSLNIISFGSFEKAMKKYHFDKLFHLSLLLELDNNKYIVYEKNEEINIVEGNTYKKGCELMNIDLSDRKLTLNEIISNTKQKMGEKNFYDYDGRHNNCQNFILETLKANKLNNQKYEDFIYQDLEELWLDVKKANPFLENVMNLTTKAGRIFNRLIGKGNDVDIDEFYENLNKNDKIDINIKDIIDNMHNNNGKIDVIDLLKGGNIYCGSKELPKNKTKFGNAQECAKIGQIRRYGIKKVKEITKDDVKPSKKVAEKPSKKVAEKVDDESSKKEKKLTKLLKKMKNNAKVPEVKKPSKHKNLKKILKKMKNNDKPFKEIKKVDDKPSKVKEIKKAEKIAKPSKVKEIKKAEKIAKPSKKVTKKVDDKPKVKEIKKPSKEIKKVDDEPSKDETGYSKVLSKFPNINKNDRMISKNITNLIKEYVDIDDNRLFYDYETKIRNLIDGINDDNLYNYFENVRLKFYNLK
jgi:hypothetical protein